jgi:polyisoprenoid-binding protein YceI
VTLPAPAGDGLQQTVTLEGTFTIHGVSKPVSVTVEGMMLQGQLQIVGSFPIALADYGMAPPENPIASVDSKVMIEFRLFLEHH